MGILELTSFLCPPRHQYNQLMSRLGTRNFPLRKEAPLSSSQKVSVAILFLSRLLKAGFYHVPLSQVSADLILRPSRRSYCVPPLTVLGEIQNDIGKQTEILGHGYTVPCRGWKKLLEDTNPPWSYSVPLGLR
jgi:hypothetical protein